MSANNSIFSSKAPEPVGHYPHARRTGNLLFLSGIGPRKKGSKDILGVILDDNGKIISYKIEEQCRSLFQNVKWILEEAGSSWDKIIEVTVYLTNMKNEFPVFNKLWDEFFKDNPPCQTTVEVKSVPTQIAIELKCIAEI